MVRKIIEIEEARCNGCGLCAEACHEGAIAMVDGKARLLRDDYCDGLGDCLPACPVDAIHFVEREAEAYDAEAVAANIQKKQDDGFGRHAHTHHGGGCPGAKAYAIRRPQAAGGQSEGGSKAEESELAQWPATEPTFAGSELSQWPVQIKLAPTNAPYFNGAKLLIAADCAAYAHANFHGRFMKGHVTLIGCPKLDGVDYTEKLAEILKSNDIKSAAVVRMEVPCCGGLQDAFVRALAASSKMIPWQVYTLSTDGRLLED